MRSSEAIRDSSICIELNEDLGAVLRSRRNIVSVFYNPICVPAHMNVGGCVRLCHFTRLGNIAFGHPLAWRFDNPTRMTEN